MLLHLPVSAARFSANLRSIGSTVLAPFVGGCGWPLDVWQFIGKLANKLAWRWKVDSEMDLKFSLVNAKIALMSRDEIYDIAGSDTRRKFI